MRRSGSSKKGCCSKKVTALKNSHPQKVTVVSNYFLWKNNCSEKALTVKNRFSENTIDLKKLLHMRKEASSFEKKYVWAILSYCLDICFLLLKFLLRGLFCHICSSIDAFQDLLLGLQFNPFLSNVLFWSPWKPQEIEGFRMYSGGSKGNTGKEKIKGSYWGSWLIRFSLFRFLNDRVLGPRYPSLSLKICFLKFDIFSWVCSR